MKANDPQKWNEVPGLTGREPTIKIKVDLHKLTRDDFNISSQPILGDADAKAKVRADLDEKVGMKKAVEYFDRIEKSVEYVEGGGNVKVCCAAEKCVLILNLLCFYSQVLQTCLNMCITGNPGTGA